tara:strand:- start:119 stop:634 length:516 start_codon:yes stop_codon:yes gene_type:complete
MAGINLIMSAVRLLKAGSRAAAKKGLQKVQPKASEKEVNAALDAAKRGIVISDKTGMPISQLVKKGTTSQTLAKRIAKKAAEAGITKGRVQGLGAGAVGALGIDALVDSINKVTESRADTKPASTASRKSPEGGQTIKENRRVVSKTNLNKGGTIKAKAGASVPPNRMSRK